MISKAVTGTLNLPYGLRIQTPILETDQPNIQAIPSRGLRGRHDAVQRIHRTLGMLLAERSNQGSIRVRLWKKTRAPGMLVG